jgi:hypothetical protein
MLAIMLHQPFFKIPGNTGVQRCIGAAQDIDMPPPLHVQTSAGVTFR